MLGTQNQGPPCAACGSPMKLTVIVPSLRTFACPHCKRVQQHIIESAATEAWVAQRVKVAWRSPRGRVNGW
jgi:hypothetical protein